MKKILLLGAVALLVAGVFGCAKKDDITIAGIVFQNDLFMRTVQLGMSDKAKELGVKVLLGNSDNKVEKEAQLIDTYIASGVDVIAITPLSAEGSVAALKRAQDAGIKIVFFNTEANIDNYINFISAKNEDMGRTTGEYAAKFLKSQFGDAPVSLAILGFEAQLPEQSRARTDSFTEVVLKMPNVKVVAKQDAWLAEKAVQVVGDMLTANPNINAIYAANEGGMVGAVRAVKNAGLEGKVFVWGVGGSEQLAQMLLSDDNILQEATDVLPYEIGQYSVESAVRAIKGEPVEKVIVVPVRPLDRNDPADLEEYRALLKEYSSK